MTLSYNGDTKPPKQNLFFLFAETNKQTNKQHDGLLQHSWNFIEMSQRQQQQQTGRRYFSSEQTKWKGKRAKLATNTAQKQQ